VAVTLSAYRGAFLDGVWPDASSWIRLLSASGVALWLGIEIFDRAQRGFPDAL
jgi:ABC-type polysaccharide/polyol phosphate export permease